MEAPTAAATPRAQSQSSPAPQQQPAKLDARTPEEKKRVLGKEALLQLPVLLLAVLTGLSWAALGGKTGVNFLAPALGNVFGPLAMLGLWLIAYGLATLLGKQWWLSLITGCISVSILAVWLGLTGGMILAALFLLALWIVGFLRARAEMKNLVRIRPWRTLKRALPGVAAGLVLMSAVRVYGHFLPLVKGGTLTLPPTVISEILKPLEGSIGQAVPGFSLKGNIGDLYAGIVIGQIDQQLANVQGQLPEELSNIQDTARKAGYQNANTVEGLRRALKQPEFKKALTEQLTKDTGNGSMTATISKQFGIEINPSEDIISGVTKIANAELNHIAGPFIPLFPWIIALLYFLGMSSFTIPVLWVVYLCVALLLRLLERTKLFDVVLVKEPVEHITLLT